MPVGLRDARVLLTGATGGIGGAIARALAAAGASVIVSGRRVDALDALAAAIGGIAISADLADPAGVDALLAAAGELDVLVACAALPASGRLATLTQRDVDRALEVNLRAPIALARALTPRMVERRRGQLVFIGSLSGTAATAGASIYCASKFGLRGFALALRAELAPAGVGVTHIQPGFIREAGMYADTGISLPRWMGTRTPQAVASAVVDAIAHDRAEVTVAAPFHGAGAKVAAVAPSLAAWATRRLGGDEIALEFEERQAGKR